MEQLDLSFFFKTKAEAADFSIRLAAITEEVYRTDFNLDKVISEHLGIQKKDKFMALLRDNNINTGSNTAVLEFLGKILEKITAMSLVTMTLAIEPPEEILQILSQWFLLNTNRQVVFDIQVDPKLIAGLTLTFNGKYKDYSIRELVQKVITEVNNSSVTTDSSPAPYQSIEHITFAR